MRGAPGGKQTSDENSKGSFFGSAHDKHALAFMHKWFLLFFATFVHCAL